MTWVRLDDGTPLHPKLLDAGPEAAWLWVAGLAHANRHTTNGFIAKAHLGSLYPHDAWGPSKIRRLAAVLVRIGMWVDEGESYRIHQYAEYQEEALKDQVEARRAAARERKRRQREREKQRAAGECHAVTGRDVTRDSHGDHRVTVTGDSARDQLRDAPRDQPRDEPREASGARPAMSHPPDPSRPVPSGKKKTSSSLPSRRDPLQPAALDPAVVELHEAWRVACGFPNHRFRGAYDNDAGILAEAIAAHGLADCILVANHAPNDGMVSGRLDDKGRKHDTIRYIFGNNDAFSRILRAAHEVAGKARRKRSAAELVAEARRL